MASGFYNSYKAGLFGQGTAVDLDTDTIKVALVTSGYTPDFDVHDFFNDITNEVVGTGYTAGGATLTSPVVTQNNAADRGEFDAADTSWASSTLTARGAVMYKSTGVSSTSPLIYYYDFGADISTTAGTFTIIWSASGIFRVT